ncbi:epoxide hydrolase 1 [Crotalus adamanteus]|uniref:Epoxide hydrolase n=1 Tax=Crotalus adamanteus TaxID=8729 RepID=A0AAW1CBN0_CROAD
MWQEFLQTVRSFDTSQQNVITASCVIGGGSLLIYWLLTRRRMKTLEIGDGWWGLGEKPSRSQENQMIRPFQVKTSEKEIQDLYRRLDQTRYTPPLEGAAFHYGFNSNYLQKVVSYWRNQFDWQKQVKILNQYPHYKTTIEGIEVHFIHVKPSHISEDQIVRPLLMVHGWPGSFYEFYKIIPLLINPSSRVSNSEDVVFEIICPSIPGYGFSEPPHHQGFNSLAAARIFHKLMQRLGFEEYYLQGGDWGSKITMNMAQMLPKSVKGLHVNMIFISKYGLGAMATKPDTAGCGLNDSPVGLAAYILEKFSTWTDKSFLNMEDGNLERKYTLDELLTNIMIYWVTSSIVPSMRFYKENLSKDPNTTPDAKIAIYVPTGIAAFPNELLHCPRSWAKKKFKNIVTYTYMPRGGHFAAFEEPELLAQDIRQFVKKVEHLN